MKHSALFFMATLVVLVSRPASAHQGEHPLVLNFETVPKAAPEKAPQTEQAGKPGSDLGTSVRSIRRGGVSAKPREKATIGRTNGRTTAE